MQINLGQPSNKQLEFLKATSRYVAYGGARGGGKSWCIRFKAVALAMCHPGITILIVRATYDDLKKNHIRELQKMLRGVAKYKETDKLFEFPNGSVIYFQYCDNANDIDRFQGVEYDVAFIDEATQLSEEQFRAISASIRGVNNFPHRVYLTCNPGGVGHAWVKRLFIDRDYQEHENPVDYTFIPAKVSDNKILLETDTNYIEMLKSLPEGLRRAWLEGDWDALAGQYFSEFRKDKHVIEPIEIPSSWRRYVSIDYGLDMLACYWSAFAPDGTCYIYRELYQSNLIVSEAAERMLELTGDEDIFAYLAPSDLWGKSAETGRSQAESFNDSGVYLTKVVARSRVDGWMDVHEWLSSGKLKIFSTCNNLIRCFPLIQHDDHRPNDTANDPHELTHSLDSIRYLLGGRPVPRIEENKKQSTMPYALQSNEFRTEDESYW